MQSYTSLNSGITGYASGLDFIDVQFRSGAIYRYTYAVPGMAEVSEMKQLAAQGRGLATYISQHVKERYALRLK